MAPLFLDCEMFLPLLLVGSKVLLVMRIEKLECHPHLRRTVLLKACNSEVGFLELQGYLAEQKKVQQELRVGREGQRNSS